MRLALRRRSASACAALMAASSARYASEVTAAGGGTAIWVGPLSTSMRQLPALGVGARGRARRQVLGRAARPVAAGGASERAIDERARASARDPVHGSWSLSPTCARSGGCTGGPRRRSWTRRRCGRVRARRGAELEREVRGLAAGCTSPSRRACEKFIWFETNGMSCRRMSPPPRVLLRSSEIGIIQPPVHVAGPDRVVEDVGHLDLVGQEQLAVGEVRGPVERDVAAPGVGAGGVGEEARRRAGSAR